MTWLPWLAGQIVPMMLVATRVLGLFMTAPLLASRTIPLRARALTGLMFALAVYPLVLDSQTRPPAPIHDLPSLGLVLATETLLGASIGLIAGIPLLSLQLGGHLMGHQMGLALARSFNPELETETGVVGQLMFFMGAMVFLVLDGFEHLHLTLLESFRAIPPGAAASPLVPLETVVSVVSSGFELALRVSMPVVGTILLVLIAMGALMKTMPQINILSVGFAIKILAGLATLLAALAAIEGVVAEEFAAVFDRVAQWVLHLSAP